MIRSVEVDKAFSRIQQTFLIKILTRIEENS